MNIFGKFFLFFLIVLSFFLIKPVFADQTTCPSIYGAQCPTGALSVDKKVVHPTSGELFETLGSNVHFLPGQLVTFKIRVQNTGSIDLRNIQLTDQFPDFLDFISGQGNFDSNRDLNTAIDLLKPSEFRDFDIVGKVQADKNLPRDGICVTNHVEARSGEFFSSDNSVVCLQPQVLGVTTELPRTGPGAALVLISSVFLSVASLIFFKKAKI